MAAVARKANKAKAQKTAKTKVCAIYTGGTIGMVPREYGNPDSPLRPGSTEEFMEYLPGSDLDDIDFDVIGLTDDDDKPVPPLDSSDVASEHWRFMAKAIAREYDNYDGFVILHGTDTMAYTSSALSFMLVNLAKPVVVTGSQLPLPHGRSDGRLNLTNALYVAGYKATGVPCVPEVSLCFGDSLLRGNRVRKVSTSSWQGFGTPNYPRLGQLGEHIVVNTGLLRPVANNVESPFFAREQLDSRVLDIGLFPGFNADVLSSVIQSPEVRGIVLRTFGAGNAPNNNKFLDAIERAIEKQGKVMVNITQCLEGKVEAGLYEASSQLLERGVISGIDMTPEAALTKLMWLLAEAVGEDLQTQMQINQAGEQTESLFDVRYGAGSGSGAVVASRAPSGQFRKVNLTRAVLRISGVEPNVSEGEPVKLRVFLNMPMADGTTKESDPHFARGFETVWRAENGSTVQFIGDVTPAVRRVVDDGRAITVSVVREDGRSLQFTGLFLALFAVG